MLNSDILKEYFNNLGRKGFIKSDELVKKCLSSANMDKTFAKYGLYIPTDRKNAKLILDADILLSEILESEFGFTTPNYVPVKVGFKKGLAYDNILRKGVWARDFIESINRKEGTDFTIDTGAFCRTKKGNLLANYFTKSGMKRKLLLNVLNATMGNSVDNSSLIYSVNSQGKICDVMPSSFMRSGQNFREYFDNAQNEKSYKLPKYTSEFSDEKKFSDEVVDSFIYRKEVKNYFPDRIKRQIGVKMQLVDPREKSMDIESATGYCLNGDYLHKLNENLSSTGVRIAQESEREF